MHISMIWSVLISLTTDLYDNQTAATLRKYTRGKLWLIIKNFTFNYITSIANFYSELFLHIDIKLFVLVISNQQLSNNFVP